MSLPTIPYLSTRESYDIFFGKSSKKTPGPKPSQETQLSAEKTLEQAMRDLDLNRGEPNRNKILKREDLDGWDTVNYDGSVSPNYECVSRDEGSQIYIADLHATAIRMLRQDIERNYHHCMGVLPAETELENSKMIREGMCPESATTAEVAKWFSGIPRIALWRATGGKVGVDDWEILNSFKDYVEPGASRSYGGLECLKHLRVYERLRHKWEKIYLYVMGDDFILL
ncbi:hypothetical protein TWF281_001999 [Arthrobotrys megalospora]